MRRVDQKSVYHQRHIFRGGGASRGCWLVVCGVQKSSKTSSSSPYHHRFISLLLLTNRNGKVSFFFCSFLALGALKTYRISIRGGKGGAKGREGQKARNQRRWRDDYSVGGLTEQHKKS
ncbi:hypothetical protein B9Z55_020806 [Caenorhabditis nigoni]|nr:hypothetical protein B9Z55_020806 [Caenorhabditis nigoni]